MKSFEWIDATNVDEASRLLGESTHDRPVIAKAGGMDLLDLMKEGLLRPHRLVNLRGIAGLDEIHIDAGGTSRIGALTTLARIASHPGIRDRFGALAAAAEHAATPQVRNVATLGGNLLQRPRCWYFRNEHFAGSDIAAAVREGENQYHGIFDTQMSPFVHASTPATALAAYDATVLAPRVGTIAVFLLPLRLAITTRWQALRLSWFARAQLRVLARRSPVVRAQRRELRADIGRFIHEHLRRVRRVAELRSYERLFSVWHVFHLPFFYMLVVAALIHVLAVHMY